MSTIRLSYPVWVRRVSKHYILTPLLFQGPEVESERFDRAKDKLRGMVEKFFNEDWKLDRSNLENVLWYQFHPQFEFQVMELQFEYGSRFFQGRMAVVWFSYLGGTVVMLPGVDRHMFVLADEKAKKTDVSKAVIVQLQALARKYRKKHGADFPIHDHEAEKGEHWTLAEQAVFVKQKEISFESEEELFFAQFFGAGAQFDGRVEIHRVGHSLNGLYPDNLHVAHRRDELVDGLTGKLFTRGSAPIVLLGPRKVGKTAILHESVKRYLRSREKDTHHLSDHVWYLDPTRLIAGMSIVGAWQRRLESIIQYLIKPLEDHPDRQDILYVDNVVALFRVGKSAQNDMTMSDVLKPYLQQRKLQLVVESTVEAWDLVAEADRGFTDLFQVIRVEEPDEVDTLRILNRVRLELEEENFLMESEVLRSLYDHERRYHQPSSLMGRSAERLRQLAIRNRQRETEFDIIDLEDELEWEIPLTPQIAEVDYQLIFESVASHFRHFLVGQPEVSDALTDLVSQLKAQLSPPNQPIRSMLFIGPTGVGKTQAAKVLADYLFLHQERLVRIDMNEYLDPGAASRLIGDPQHPEGHLTSKVRHNPFCVLLLDEIEKAHPDVHDLLLQLLDEGRLTDALGQVTSFANTVVIMTSNLGADRVGKSIRFAQDKEDQAGVYRKAIQDFFRPEFINRIDQILIFKSLQSEHIERIADLQIRRLMQRQGLRQRQIFLRVAPAVLTYLAGRGYDPQMGGRALKRQIETDLVHLLAAHLSQFKPGVPLLIFLRPGQSAIEVISRPLVEVPPSPRSKMEMVGKITAGKEDFESVLEEYEKLRDEVEEVTDDRLDELDMDLGQAMQVDALLRELFEMKDEIRSRIEQLYDLQRQFQIRRNLNLRGGHFRVKTVSHGVARLSGDDRPVLQDQVNQENVTDFLSQVSQAADTLVNEGASLFFQYRLQLDRMQTWTKAAEERGIDHLVLKFRLLNAEEVSIGDTNPVAFLRGLYQILGWTSADPGEDTSEVVRISLKNTGVPKAHRDSLVVPYLFVRGLGIRAAVRAEIGVHRFANVQEDTLVEVRLAELGADEWEAARENWDKQGAGPDELFPERIPDTYEVIRRYKLSYQSRRFGKTWEWEPSGTLYDLRTKWLLELPAHRSDLDLLFYKED